MTETLDGLARGGRLRVAINTGNRALVQEVGGELAGISPALARRLAAEIDAAFEPVVYEGAGKVFADAGADRWDVGFLAIDPERAKRVAFTRPYVTIEATYAVRADSDFREVAEADRPGVEVLVATGSAYDLYLSSSLKHARLSRVDSPGESFEAFRAGPGDLVGGVRQSLETAFAGDAGFRILPGAITKVEQAMVLPHPEDPRIATLDGFVARAIAEGFVATELDRKPDAAPT